jgi:hypothetical protein
MMVKVWIIGAVFVIPVTCYVLFRRWRYYKHILVGAIIVLAGTLATYARLFWDNYTIIEILKVQKWLYWYQAGKVNRLFTIWPLIFLNRWYVWWGETSILKDSHWSLSWPVAIGIALIACLRVVFTVRQKNRPLLDMCAISAICYFVFMSLGQASARYLLPILPICYVLSAWILYTICKNILSHFYTS